jgi:hypothetical protein
MPSTRALRRSSLLLVCGFGIVVATWSRGPWVGLLAFAAFFLIAIGFAFPERSGLASNLAAILGVLLIFEVAYWRADGATRERNRQKYLDLSSMRSDPDLGYAPRPGQVRVIAPGITYTIGRDGLRSSGVRDHADDAAGILFFVDSFTFGEGVADDEAYPYRVGAELGSSYKVFNLAYIGYGPHQMLSMLETGLVARVVDRRPSHAFYLVLEDHVERAAGRRFWDVHGPRYVLDQGRPFRVGNFDDPWEPGQSLLGASYLARRIAMGVRDSRPDERFDRALQLFSAIVAESARKLETFYPGIEVHLLFWSAFSEHSQAIRNALIESGGTVHDVVDVFGEFEHREEYAGFAGHGSTSPIRFQLNATDLHPNPWAHAMLADYVVEVVRGEHLSGPSPRRTIALSARPRRRSVGPCVLDRCERSSCSRPSWWRRVPATPEVASRPGRRRPIPRRVAKPLPQYPAAARSSSRAADGLAGTCSTSR